MGDEFLYKQGNKDMQMNSLVNQDILLDQSKDDDFRDFHHIFIRFTNLFNEQKYDYFVETMRELANLIFQRESQFIFFDTQSPSILQIFFQQCADVLQQSPDEIKETIFLHFHELIKNKSFSQSFANFKGDLMLINYYQKISENANNLIIDILMFMKLSPHFPIHIFKDYFMNNKNDVRFTTLFTKSMDQSANINLLFDEFVTFPPPQMHDAKTFELFCYVIISFFQHSLDEQLFVKSNYFDNILFLQSDFCDQDIILFLQLTDRLSDHAEILSKIQPNLLFSLFLYNNNKKINVLVMNIICSILKKNVKMPSQEFIQKYVNEAVISVVMKNLDYESFVVRAKSLMFLNNLIVESNDSIFPLLFKYHNKNNKDFIEVISDIIIDLLSSDEMVIVFALELAYYIFIYLHKQDNQSDLLRLVNIWVTIGIYDKMQCLALSKDKFSNDAQIIFDKIKKVVESHL